jgi:hypothetical protein
MATQGKSVSSSPQTTENGVARCFAKLFCKQAWQKVLITDSESVLSGSSNETTFSFLGLSRAEQVLFQDAKMIC